MRAYKYKLPNRCSLCGNKPITKMKKQCSNPNCNNLASYNGLCAECIQEEYDNADLQQEYPIKPIRRYEGN